MRELELRRARARAVRGDQAWRARLQHYEHGDALIVELTASAVIEHPARGQAQAPCCSCHEAVWIDQATEPRELTERLRALVRRDVKTVAAGLRDRAIHLSARPEQITVELSIDRAVTARLTSAVSTQTRGPAMHRSRRALASACPRRRPR